MSAKVGIGMLVAAVLFGTAGAQDQAKDKKKDPDTIFGKLDKNSDNKLSKDEFLKLAELGRDKEKAREILGKVFDKHADRETKALNRDQFKKLLTDLGKRKNDSDKS